MELGLVLCVICPRGNGLLCMYVGRYVGRPRQLSPDEKKRQRVGWQRPTYMTYVHTYIHTYLVEIRFPEFSDVQQVDSSGLSNHLLSHHTIHAHHHHQHLNLKAITYVHTYIPTSSSFLYSRASVRLPIMAHKEAEMARLSAYKNCGCM